MNKIGKQYKIDFAKIEHVEDIKMILRALGITFTITETGSEQEHRINELHRMGLLKEVNE